MDIDFPYLEFSIINAIFVLAQNWTIISGFGILIILILCSALISGSEVAYFSLSPKDQLDLKEEGSVAGKRILHLKNKPRILLATILISNNFINIAIVIITDYVLRIIFTNSAYNEIADTLYNAWGLTFLSVELWVRIISFFITVVLVTFLLVLLGETTPKIYANFQNLKFAKFMSMPLIILSTIFGPFSRIMVGWSKNIEKRIMQNRSPTDKKELGRAIELTVSQDISSEDEEANILKGIIKFGDVTVKQIMKSRVDVVALDAEADFESLMKIVKAEGYSRIPIYNNDFDNIIGILYVKDLLGHTHETKDFEWNYLIRENMLYIPETKKINELLKEFQQRRLHMAIVVDEYGGSAGIVTLEDIMEEVIGDIKDEFDDDEEVEYLKIDENNYIFEGKTLLNDVCRIIGEETDIFDDIKGEADSLAGLILEVMGQIPKVDKEINFDRFKFKIVAATKRRIEKINITILRGWPDFK